MKAKLSLSFLLTVFVFTAYAQCDNTFYPMEADHYYEVKAYNKKDKLQSTSQYTIAAVAETDNGYEATVNSKTLDKKGEMIGEGDFAVICEDGQLKMDMQRLLTSLTQLQNTQGMNVEIEGNLIIIPASLNVGETLPESTTTITMGMEGVAMTMNTTSVTIRDRTVVALEGCDHPGRYVSLLQNHLRDERDYESDGHRPRNGIHRNRVALGRSGHGAQRAV